MGKKAQLRKSKENERRAKNIRPVSDMWMTFAIAELTRISDALSEQDEYLWTLQGEDGGWVSVRIEVNPDGFEGVVWSYGGAFLHKTLSVEHVMPAVDRVREAVTKALFNDSAIDYQQSVSTVARALEGFFIALKEQPEHNIDSWTSAAWDGLSSAYTTERTMLGYHRLLGVSVSDRENRIPRFFDLPCGVQVNYAAAGRLTLITGTENCALSDDLDAAVDFYGKTYGYVHRMMEFGEGWFEHSALELRCMLLMALATKVLRLATGKPAAESCTGSHQK